MGSTAAVEGEDRTLVPVYLTCIVCGTVEEIHVFEDRRLPAKMYWECFSCQSGKNRGRGRSDACARR